jgi:hypothetical protein
MRDRSPVDESETGTAAEECPADPLAGRLLVWARPHRVLPKNAQPIRSLARLLVWAQPHRVLPNLDRALNPLAF